MSMSEEVGKTDLERLLTKRAFIIPKYQRFYSWEKKEWEDLWNDIDYLDENSYHFFGTFILKLSKKVRDGGDLIEIYELIDGQQRLATIIMLVSVIIQELKSIKTSLPEDQKQELEDIIKEATKLFLRGKNINKLRMLGLDEEFFREYVIYGKFYEYITQKACDSMEKIFRTPSQRRIFSCLQFFLKKVREYRVRYENKYKESLLDLLAKIKNNLIAHIYFVEDLIQASHTFIVLNDRGKPLTNLERTKSQIMDYIIKLRSKDYEKKVEEIHKTFEKIYNLIQSINFRLRRYRIKLNENDLQRLHFILYVDESMLKKFREWGLLKKASRKDAVGRYHRLLRKYFSKSFKKYRNRKIGHLIDLLMNYSNKLLEVFETVDCLAKISVEEVSDLERPIEREN